MTPCYSFSNPNLSVVALVRAHTVTRDGPTPDETHGERRERSTNCSPGSTLMLEASHWMIRQPQCHGGIGLREDRYVPGRRIFMRPPAAGVQV
jgi:hypothetical protein